MLPGHKKAAGTLQKGESESTEPSQLLIDSPLAVLSCAFAGCVQPGSSTSVLILDKQPRCMTTLRQRTGCVEWRG